MVAREQIQDFARRVAQDFSPDKIILFGSHAYGKPTEDSDVDLLVVMPHGGKGCRKASEIRLRIEAKFPMDLMVRSSEEIDQRLMLGDFFVEEIVNRGVILYERDHARGARQSRG